MKIYNRKTRFNWLGTAGFIVVSMGTSFPAQADVIGKIAPYAGLATTALKLATGSGSGGGSSVGGYVSAVKTSADSVTLDRSTLELNNVNLKGALVGFSSITSTADIDGTMISNNSSLVANQVNLINAKVGYLDIDTSLEMRSAVIRNGSNVRVNNVDIR